MFTKLICLIGVDHRIQWEPTCDFIKYLTTVCNDNNIQLLAEEFSQEQVSKNDVLGSTLQSVAKNLNLPHLFCDPNSNERKELGFLLDDLEKAHKKELEWLSRIRLREENRILFLCGDNHLISFSVKLNWIGYQSKILGSGWGNDWAGSEKRISL